MQANSESHRRALLLSTRQPHRCKIDQGGERERPWEQEGKKQGDVWEDFFNDIVKWERNKWQEETWQSWLM